MHCEACGQEIKKKIRTNRQNASLHLWFSLISEALNEAGYDMRATIRQDVEIPWTAETVKEYVWRPVMVQYLREKSTTRMSTKDIDKIFDIVNRIIGERTGVYVPFPSYENLEHHQS